MASIRRYGIIQVLRLTCWSGLPLLGLTGLLARPANAMGFTGTFDPQTWLLINTNPVQQLYYNPANNKGENGDPDYTTYATPGFQCADTFNGPTDNNATACIQDYYDYSFTMIGSDSLANDTTLRLTNSSPLEHYIIAFNWSFTGPGETDVLIDQSVRISVSSGNISTFGYSGTYFESTGITFPPSQSATVFLPANATLEFTASNPSGGAIPIFSVTGFDAQPVPAPLPAAGAATAFGYSRCLRRRLKRQRPKGSCPPVLPPHPSVYLNLPPAAVRSLPVSFSYSAMHGGAAAHNEAA